MRILKILLVGLALIGLEYGGLWYTGMYSKGSVSATAWVLNEDGYIVSAAHVVGDRKHFEVLYHNEYVEARLIAVDRYNDISIFKIDRKTPNVLKLQLSFRDNEQVYMYGFPLGTIKLVMTRGVIRHKNASPDYATNAQSCPGNSGGPLIGDYGAVGLLDYNHGPDWIKHGCDNDGGGATSVKIRQLAQSNGIVSYVAIYFVNKRDLYNEFRINNAVMIIYAE